MLSLDRVLEGLGVIICGGAVFSILLVVMGARLLNNPRRNLTRPGSGLTGQEGEVEPSEPFGGVPATGGPIKPGTEPVIGSSGFSASNPTEPILPEQQGPSGNAENEKDAPWWEK